MLGANLPTFGFVDLFSVQIEYLKSPYTNSFLESGKTNQALPDIPSGNDRLASDTEYNSVAKQDDFSWSVLIRKQVVGGITLSAQAARDHARFASNNNWFGPGVNANEALRTSDDWYWMLQFAFGI
jgi:hypothetical protein